MQYVLQCLPLWPESSTGKLCVRVVGSESASKSFFFNKQDNGTLLCMDQVGISAAEEILQVFKEICIVGCNADAVKPELCVCLQYGGVIVDVNISDHSTVISFTDYYDGAAPALLVNHTPNAAITFSQRSEI